MEILTASRYCAQSIPDTEPLKPVIREQRKFAKKMADLTPFIDSEVKLKTEFIGKVPPDPGETGTLGALIREYTSAYIAMHDTAMDGIEQARKQIEALLGSDDFRALQILERIPALQPPASTQFAQQANELLDQLFRCPSPSRSSLEGQLRRGPLHECGLSLENAGGHVSTAQALQRKVIDLFDSAFNGKCEVFLSPTVRGRLEKGRKEKVIASILDASDVAAVRKVVVKACLEDESVVETISRYMKKIVVRRVRIGDFKPSMSTVEKDKIASLASEFQEFLEQELAQAEEGGDSLPMLQIE
jgi:hypothetical protein